MKPSLSASSCFLLFPISSWCKWATIALGLNAFNEPKSKLLYHGKFDT